MKIIAKDLDKALAGLPLYVAHHEDEVEIYKVNIIVSCYIFPLNTNEVAIQPSEY